MRVFLFLAASALLAGAAIAQTPLIGETDVARPGGSYTTLAALDVAACARLCAEDGICMAWTYREAANNACELKAVAPPTMSEIGARSGLSQRAPAFLRQVADVAPSTETPAARQAPMVAAIEPTVSDYLLGGLEGGSLRPRLGGHPSP